MQTLTIADLHRIKEENRARFALKKGGHRAKVTIHMGTCGIAAGARKVMGALLDEISRADTNDVAVLTSGCAGMCAHEPLAIVETLDHPPVRYCNLNDQKIREIFSEHVLGNSPSQRYALVC